MLNGQSREIRTPVRISLAASTMISGVSRFKVPSSSFRPNRPQEFPRGPVGSSGSASKGIVDASALLAIVHQYLEISTRAYLASIGSREQLVLEEVCFAVSDLSFMDLLPRVFPFTPTPRIHFRRQNNSRYSFLIKLPDILRSYDF